MCCGDDGVTGCGEGFVCSTDGNHDHAAMCTATDPDFDRVPAIVPRYKLCSVTTNMTNTYALPMRDPEAAATTSMSQKQHKQGHKAEGRQVSPAAAYLSTHGPVHEDDAIFVEVMHAIILIHGSLRDADDYLCCTTAALPAGADPDSVLFVAPWFLAPEDGDINVTTATAATHADASSFALLRWTARGVHVEHTWRYGAPSLDYKAISSYDVVDRLLAIMADRRKFPSLQQIVLTGHSAGGQMVQRFALLSNVMKDNAGSGSNLSRPVIRTVVANPKSYAYLDARRWITKDAEFRVPDAAAIAEYNCPTYNEWQWGLESSTTLDAPYMNAAIANAGGIDAVVERYASRNIIYLSGEQDVLYNGDCEAVMQGPNRWVRSQRFFAALHQVYGDNHGHRRWAVPNVHHDHCLMYQSPQGQLALFGGPDSKTEPTSLLYEARGRNHQHLESFLSDAL